MPAGPGEHTLSKYVGATGLADSEPWMVGHAIAMIDWFLHRECGGQASIIEWGSGSSSKWLLERCKLLVTIEHDPKYHDLAMTHQTSSGRGSGKWQLIFQPPDSPDNRDRLYETHADAYRNQTFKRYVKRAAAEVASGEANLIVVDGRCRHECMGEAVDLVDRDCGMVVLDNTERKRYLPAADKFEQATGMRRVEFSNGAWRTTVWHRHV